MIIDAILSPPEIDLLPGKDLRRTVCVVFDILRATSSIVTALAHGTVAVRPVLTIEEAFAERERWPDAILGGERHGDRIEGFDLGNSPMEYCRPDLRRIITTTTNGTVALRACAGAETVIVGALLNMEAVRSHLRQMEPERIALVCAGTGRDLALEDVLAAGMLATLLPDASLTDAAETAVALYEKHAANLNAALRQSANGRVLVERGRGGDVDWCAQVSKFSVIGVMRDGVIETV
jgi:2-phosphosulfolactate phosphatase